MNKCSVDGCDRDRKGVKYCGAHYMRLKRHGHVGGCQVKTIAPKGSGHINHDGYRYLEIDGREVFEHVLIVEKVLGRRLRGQEEVHHANEVKADNRPDNLVICPNRSYHKLLHTRTRALNACGNANWLKCKYCHKYDDPEKLKIFGFHRYHSDCELDYRRALKQRNTPGELP